MKRTLMVWAMLFGVTAIVQAQATLSVGSASGTPGSTVELAVNLTSTAAVSAVQFDVGYNASVLTFLQALNGPTAGAAGKSVSFTSSTAQATVRILVAGLNTNAIADGTLAILQFRINAGTAAGRTTVTPSGFQATSPQGTSLATQLGNAGFVEVIAASTTTTTTRVTTTTTTLPRNEADLILGKCGGARGSTIEIEAFLLSKTPVSAVQFDVLFDAGVLAFQQAFAGPAATNAVKSVSTASLASGSQRILIAGLNQATVANGVAAYLQFRIAANAGLGISPLTPANFLATSPQGTTYKSLGTKPGSIEVIAAPTLERMSPESGPPKTLLIFAGNNLGSCARGARASFSGPGGYLREVNAVEATGRHLAAEVPGDATGTLTVSLSVGGLTTNGLNFMVDTAVPYNSPSTHIEDSTSLGSTAAPAGAYFNRRTNTAYIADNLNGTVSAIDAGTRSVLSSVAVGSRPTRLAVNSVTGEIVVTNSGSNDVSILRGNPGQDLQNLGQQSVGRNPSGVAINHITNRAVIANTGDNNVTIIDLNTRQAVGNIAVGNQPTGVAVDIARNRAFVTNMGDATVSVIDLGGNRVVSTITGVGSQPGAVDIHLESGSLLVGSASGLLIRNVDTAQTRTLLAGQMVSEVVVHPARGLVAAINNAAGTMTPIELFAALADSTRAVLGTVPLTSVTVTGMAINHFTNQALVVHRAASPSGASRSEFSAENGGVSGFSRVSIPISLNFPRVLLKPGDLLGVAISNPTTDAASLQMTAITAAGQRLQGSGVSNPTTVVLPAQGQVASLDFQLFGDGVSTSGDFWFHVVAPNPGLKGFFLTGDFTSSIVGTEESGALFTDSILPAVRPGDQNLISVINPLPIAASVTMDLVANSGTVLQSVARPVPAYGLLQGRLEDFFSAARPGGQIGPGGYVRLRSVTGIRSYQQFVSAGRLDPAGLNAQSAISGPSALLFSHFVAGRDSGAGIDYETKAGIVNLETTAQSVTFTIRDDQGNLISSPQAISIPASGRTEPDIRSLFNLPTTTLTQGWLRVEGNGRLAGYLTYSTSEALAAVVSVSEPRTQLTFSQVAEEGTGFFTGLAVLNANADATSVDIAVFSGDGLQVAATGTPFNIPPNGRIVGLLNQLVGPDVLGQSGGYVVVTSTLPVHGIEIFGTSNGRAFANVPAQ